ncbi:MAG: 2,3-diphosphoglycerate-dependent phosphoglycerate mutase [Acidimicrobiia bacterium]|nr:2,3-diphosphoglycerate-dependent phosphoglycerate mutase [Acidimicrobiia bacterium]
MTHTLVLLRHGQSQWNLENRFTGWWDADLTAAGEAEATRAGEQLLDAGLLPDVVHTSLQTRAIRTVNLALDALGRAWLPVRRHWRLNERHYGDLTGLDKAETAAKHGADKVKIWRRAYDIPPPPITPENAFDPTDDPRYASLDPAALPMTECLADVVARTWPYFEDAIVEDLRLGRTVLVGAHGNSLRAIVKVLDGISDEDISELNLPTGVPIVYQLGDDLRPVERRHPLERCLGDAEEIAAAAAAVANQGTAH